MLFSFILFHDRQKNMKEKSLVGLCGFLLSSRFLNLRLCHHKQLLVRFSKKPAITESLLQISNHSAKMNDYKKEFLDYFIKPINPPLCRHLSFLY